jgi:hypothetical protein
MKILFGQIYQFALENDIVEKNYVQFVDDLSKHLLMGHSLGNDNRLKCA